MALDRRQRGGLSGRHQGRPIRLRGNSPAGGRGRILTDNDERIERRRRVIALIGALQKHDDDRAEALIAELIADSDLRRVVGALGVAGSSMVETLAKVTGRPVEDLLGELEEKMTSAPPAP